jgi:hypothetical protein
MPQLQPLPLADVGLKPSGIGSLTVTLPLVAVLPALDTASVKLPLPPRGKAESLAVFVILKSGVPLMFTVAESLADVLSPPPLTLAELVMEAGASEFTFTDTEMFG